VRSPPSGDSPIHYHRRRRSQVSSPDLRPPVRTRHREDNDDRALMLNKYRLKVGSPATTIIDFMLGRGSKCKVLLYRCSTNAAKVMFVKSALIHRVSTDHAISLFSTRVYFLTPILDSTVVRFFLHFPRNRERCVSVR